MKSLRLTQGNGGEAKSKNPRVGAHSSPRKGSQHPGDDWSCVDGIEGPFSITCPPWLTWPEPISWAAAVAATRQEQSLCWAWDWQSVWYCKNLTQIMYCFLKTFWTLLCLRSPPLWWRQQTNNKKSNIASTVLFRLPFSLRNKSYPDIWQHLK